MLGRSLFVEVIYGSFPIPRQKESILSRGSQAAAVAGGVTLLKDSQQTVKTACYGVEYTGLSQHPNSFLIVSAYLKLTGGANVDLGAGKRFIIPRDDDKCKDGAPGSR